MHCYFFTRFLPLCESPMFRLHVAVPKTKCGRNPSWRSVCCSVDLWWFQDQLHTLLGGGFNHFLFSPLPGEMIQFDSYFSNGLKPPTGLMLHYLIETHPKGDAFQWVSRIQIYSWNTYFFHVRYDMWYEIIVRKVCVIVKSADQVLFAFLPFANHGELFGQLFPPIQTWARHTSTIFVF